MLLINNEITSDSALSKVVLSTTNSGHTLFVYIVTKN